MLNKIAFVSVDAVYNRPIKDGVWAIEESL